MRPAFTFTEIREAEKSIIEKEGIPSLILMENAGKNAFDVITSLYPDIAERTIVIVCGKGNNAGDGFVIARHFLINDFPVEIYNLSQPGELKGDALINFEILGKLNSDLCSIVFLHESKPDLFYKRIDKINGKALVIDAMLGSGIIGAVKGIYKIVIEQINLLKRENLNIDVVSVDVPSGLGEGNMNGEIVDACFTVTMGAMKTELLYGYGKEKSGEVIGVNIGIPTDKLDDYNFSRRYIYDKEDISNIFPVRKKSSYKYTNGKVFIIGGSKGLSGAVIMSCEAALRSGSGAVMAAFPSSLGNHFSKKLAEVIKMELPETSEGTISGDAFGSIERMLKKADAILIGPGLSLNPETAKFLFDFVVNSAKPMVIDADALTLAARNIEIFKQRKYDSEIILTPHVGEFCRLSGLELREVLNNRFESVRKFSAVNNVNVILKSETSFCSDIEGNIFINSSGNESLGIAGSGDVLSGMIVSLLAQSGKVSTAMICGNYIHGMLADIYYDKYGNKQSASQQDLIKLIPAAITEILG